MEWVRDKLTALRNRLVDEVTEWYKHMSMWLAGLFAILIPFLLSSPDIIVSVLNSMPHELRAWMPAWLGPMLFGVVFVARYWKQRKPDA